MNRPDFPKPYCALPSECIARIRSDQEHYDCDPEGAKRERAEHEEQQRLEAEELEAYRQAEEEAYEEYVKEREFEEWQKEQCKNEDQLPF